MSDARETTSVTRRSTAVLLCGLVIVYVGSYFGTVRVEEGYFIDRSYSNFPRYTLAAPIAKEFFWPIHFLDRKLLRRERWEGDFDPWSPFETKHQNLK